MLNKFFLKYKNFVLGEIDLENYTFLDYKVKPEIFIPIELRGNPSRDKVKEFLENRCVQRDNHMIDVILKDLGLGRYDPTEIIKKTYGMDLNDCYWLTENKDDDYNLVHIRVSKEAREKRG